MSMSLKTDRLTREAHEPTHGAHRFAPGEWVLFGKSEASNVELYRVVRTLPIEGMGVQYRIRNETSGEERITPEAALRAASAPLFSGAFGR